MSFTLYASPVERKIATALVDEILRRGYTISVFDGEETTLSKSNDREAIFDFLATTDMDTLRLYRGGMHEGSILLIWGNGEDLISDHSDVPEFAWLSAP